jgi:hypothetical protein
MMSIYQGVQGGPALNWPPWELLLSGFDVITYPDFFLQNVKIIPGFQPLRFGALLAVIMPYNPSVCPVRVGAARPCAHDHANSLFFSWRPPAGRHLETDATEDCNLSQICVWNHFKTVQ